MGDQTIPVAAATVAWCEQRGHPLVTTNADLHKTFCRCGQVRDDGVLAVDWEAKWELWHDHDPDQACRCYRERRDATRGAA